MSQLGGRRVLVTGASSGIGEAVARACADAGARVACLARRAERVTALADELGGVAVPADVRDVPGTRRAVDEAAAALGGLDAVVNNAGVALPGPIAEADPEDWRTMLEVNVLGLLVVTQAAIGHLRAAERGDIVMVSSMSGRRVPGSNSGVYAGTKHAVHALSQALRRELSPDAIRVAVIAPGFVRTGIFADLDDPDARRRLQERLVNEGIDPQVVARQVVQILAEPPEVNVYEVAVLATAQET